MESQAHPHEANAVGLVQGVGFPVDVSRGVLEEASNVFERSPFLGLVSRLFQVRYEFVEITVSVLSQGSKIARLPQEIMLTFRSCQLFR